MVMGEVNNFIMKIKLILKSIIYRGWSTVLTFIISYIITGKLSISGSIALLELVFKTFFYYIYEIIWNKILKKKMKTIWFTGLSGSGKSTIAEEIIKRYEKKVKNIFTLDGDVLRSGLNSDLGFSVDDRIENIRRATEFAKLLNDKEIQVIATFIAPTNEIRNLIKKILPNVCFVYLNTSLEVCEDRDVKGLYKKARAGEIKNFTGIDSPFEPMDDAWLTLDTNELSVEQCADIIIEKLKK
jgi:adenylyl-sulfate kinase